MTVMCGGWRSWESSNFQKYAATFVITVAASGSTATFFVEIPTGDR
jgi:hypothetical protein